MARFSVGGDEDENGERSIDRRSSKKPRTTDPVSDTGKHPNSAAAAAVSTPNSRDRAKASTSSAPPPAPLPEFPVSEEDESEEEIEEESDPPQSDSQAASEEESDADDDEVQPTEVVLNGSGTIPDPDGDSGSITITLTDKDALDCPICFDPLSAPVYQCENGHIACDSCCTFMYKKCASCQWPIGYNRCRAIERVIESARVRCRNTLHGCMETLNYSKKLDHERKCIYAPCSCPHISCDYVGMSESLYTHFASHHPEAATEFRFGTIFTITFVDNNMKHVFLREREKNILFVVNRSVSSGGSCIDIVCVAPISTKLEFSYSLKATNMDSSIKLKTHVECLPKLRPQDPAKVYLLVPSDLLWASGKLLLVVKIWKI